MSKNYSLSFDYLNMDLLKGATLAGKYGMPMLRQSKATTTEAIPFHDSYKGKGKGKWVHFYIHDSHFNCIWNNPNRYLEMLKSFKGVISTDFSLYIDTPFGMQIWNTLRNRILAYWMQQEGIEVIPNVRWGKEDTYEFCFDGIPQGGTVAIGTNGCIQDKEDRFDFKYGLAKMLEDIKPQTVIVYGTMPNDIFDEHLNKGIEFINIKHQFITTRKGGDS